MSCLDVQTPRGPMQPPQPGGARALSSALIATCLSVFVVAALVALGGCSGELTVHDQAVSGPDASPPASVSVAYRPTLQADLEGAGCTGVADCHGMDGVPMVVRSGPASDEEWLFNYEEVKRRGGSVESSLLLTKPLGLGGHPSSLSAGSPMLVRWRAWINAGAPYLAD